MPYVREVFIKCLWVIFGRIEPNNEQLQPLTLSMRLLRLRALLLRTVMVLSFFFDRMK